MLVTQEWNHQGLWIVKAILRKKNKASSVTFLDFKFYYRCKIIKTAWCSLKNTHAEQWNRIESPHIKPHVHGQIIFDERIKNPQWEFKMEAQVDTLRLLAQPKGQQKFKNKKQPELTEN